MAFQEHLNVDCRFAPTDMLSHGEKGRKTWLIGHRTWVMDALHTRPPRYSPRIALLCRMVWPVVIAGMSSTPLLTVKMCQLLLDSLAGLERMVHAWRSRSLQHPYGTTGIATCDGRLLRPLRRRKGDRLTVALPCADAIAPSVAAGPT